MPTVLLAGAFGQGSPDDEAVLAAFIAALPEWQVVATSSEPALTAATHGCGAVQRRDLQALGRTVLGADAVVFAGETVFTTGHPSTSRSAHDLLISALLLAAGGQAAGKPVAMLGVGAGRLSDPRARWLARALVRRADLLVLRDEESAHTLAAVGAPIPFRVGADPAWTLVDEPPVAPGNREGVVVALGPLALERNLAERLAAVLGPLVASGTNVKLQPWQGDHTTTQSGRLASTVAARFDGRVEVTAPPADLRDARTRMAGARTAVCLCSHAMIAAAAAGTPLIAIAHELKLVGMARRLQQPAVPIDVDPPRIAATILSSLDGQAASPAAVHGEIARAAEGFRLLRLLLTHGTAPELDSFDGLSLVPTPWTAR
jgi:polysaccharide pyruvyl transferase WcaK-like protein